VPIYAYRCGNCGHAEDVLQKMSDAPLSVCPSCGQSTYSKQVTAAGFQLKGSGWYVTDFRNSGGKPAPAAADKPSAAEPAKPAATSEAKPAAPAAAATPSAT
jgi:putative FmdB family regulatory protein